MTRSIRLLIITALAALGVFGVTSAAQAVPLPVTWYASPTGSAATSTGCLQTDPCALTSATTSISDNGTVLLESGTYVPVGQVDVYPAGETIAPDPADVTRPSISFAYSNSDQPFHLATQTTVTGIDLSNSGTSGIFQYGSSVTLNHLRISLGGAGAIALANVGGTFADSLVTGSASSETGISASSGSTLQLINDTIWLTGAASKGVSNTAYGSSFMIMGISFCSGNIAGTVNGSNNILHGTGGDVTSTQTGSSLCLATPVTGGGASTFTTSVYRQSATTTTPVPVTPSSTNRTADADNAPVGLFVNQAAGDYHLLPAGTVAVNAGSSTGVETTDLEGNPRTQGSSADIGAYELPTASVSATTATVDGAASGTVSAGGPTTAVFQYGTTTAYGTSTTVQTVAGDTVAHALTAQLTGLAASTTYHVRLVSTTANGPTSTVVSTGTDASFTTAATTTTPPVTTPVSAPTTRAAPAPVAPATPAPAVPTPLFTDLTKAGQGGTPTTPLLLLATALKNIATGVNVACPTDTSGCTGSATLTVTAHEDTVKRALSKMDYRYSNLVIGTQTITTTPGGVTQVIVVLNAHGKRLLALTGSQTIRPRLYVRYGTAASTGTFGRRVPIAVEPIACAGHAAAHAAAGHHC